MTQGESPVVLCMAQDDSAVFVAGQALATVLGARGRSIRTVDLRDALGPAPVRRVAEVLGRVSARTLSGALRALSGIPTELEDALPAVVVALDPLAARALLGWRHEGRLSSPILGVAHELDPSAWDGVEVDRLAVADGIAREATQAAGRPASRIAVTGQVVAPEVAAAAQRDREELRQRFGLDERSAVVVDVRALEQEQVAAMLLQLALVAAGADLLFDAGSNAAGAAFLRRQTSTYGLRARMFGDVEEAPLLWRAADLCVVPLASEPLGRALALGVPPVVVGETGDTAGRDGGRDVEARGGLYAPSIHALAATIELGLRPERLARAREVVAARACPDAAEALAEAALDLAESREGDAAAASGADQAEERQGAGPLEEIGGDDGARPPTAGEAQAQLKLLAVSEAEARRRIQETGEEIERWERREALAARRGDAALEEAARDEVASYRRVLQASRDELERLAAERGRLEAAARGSDAAAEAAHRAGRLESDFRRMEIEDELAALKSRLKDGGS